MSEKVLDAEIKADLLDTIISAANTVVNEVAIKLHRDRITIRAVDASHVAMTDIELNKNAFLSYEAEEQTIALKIPRIQDILQLTSKNDIIRIVKEKDSSTISFQFENITQTIKEISTETITEPDLPDIDLDAEFKVDGKELQTATKATGNIDDTMTIAADENRVKITAEQDENEVEMSLERADLPEFNVNEYIQAAFALDYLSGMVKEIPRGEKARVALQTDHPVQLKFEIASGDGNIRFLLAPRIEKTK